MSYKVGDIVVLCDKATLMRESGLVFFSMDVYAKKVVVIDSVYEESYRGSKQYQYYLKENDDIAFTDSMIDRMASEDESINAGKINSCNHCRRRFFEKLSSKETLCKSCRKRDFILPYHRHYPEIEFYGESKAAPEGSQLFLGVELEVGYGGEYDENAKQVMPILNEGIEDGHFFGYCSHDGSIEEGFEIITQPATIKYHKSKIPMYQNLFSKLIHLGYRSHNTNSCGIHVHFNRNYYRDDEDLYCARLVFLIEKFWDEIVIFSRRDKYKMDRYTKKVDRCAVDFVKRHNKTEDRSSHYYAINLANKNTIEFRMFRGTLNIDTFISILEFAHKCIRIAKNKTTEEIQVMTFDDVLTKNAKKYYKARLVSLKLDEV